MAVYRVVALLTDLNTLPCINTQGYQTSDAFATEAANHFSPFLALATHKKGVFHATQGRNTPYKNSTKRRLPRRLSVRGCFCVQTFSLLWLCLLCDCYLLTLSLRLRLGLGFRWLSFYFGCWLNCGCGLPVLLLLLLRLVTHHRHDYHLIAFDSE